MSFTSLSKSSIIVTMEITEPIIPKEREDPCLGGPFYVCESGSMIMPPTASETQITVHVKKEGGKSAKEKVGVGGSRERRDCKRKECREKNVASRDQR